MVMAWSVLVCCVAAAQQGGVTVSSGADGQTSPSFLSLSRSGESWEILYYNRHTAAWASYLTCS